LALAVLQRATEYLVSTSDLAQRAPAEFRGEVVAFEREAAIAKTAPAMSSTSPAVLKASTDTAELAERLTISREGEAFRLELRGKANTEPPAASIAPSFSASCKCSTPPPCRQTGSPR
jgi:hypothetical protein